MTRQFKFRAWSKIANKMCTVKALLSDSVLLETTDGYSGSNNLNDVELMQFTGLHDKNGKPVFEGDIIRYIYNTHKPDDIEFYSMNPIVGEVVYSNMLAHYSVNGHRFMCDISKPEVIGNIHQDGELLK